MFSLNGGPVETHVAIGVETTREERRFGGSRRALPEALITCANELAARLESLDSPESMRAAIRCYTEQVRTGHIPPERMIAAFKFMLGSLPVMHGARRHEHMLLMQQLSQILIEEYCAVGLDTARREAISPTVPA